MPLTFTPGALIFDCDGTLADTMPLHFRAWRRVLDRLGHVHVFPKTQFYALGGVPAREVLVQLRDEHTLDFDVDALTEEKEAAFAELVVDSVPIPEVIAEAQRFFGVAPLAVASGGQRELVEGTLQRLGIRELFPVVVGSQDTERGKPAPDLFLLAAKRLGVDPKACVVFEDAPAGIEAARRAGMMAVDVTRYIR
jgi:beta-phosphoglucomutase-like phosphatase (HAD superfamily)